MNHYFIPFYDRTILHCLGIPHCFFTGLQLLYTAVSVSALQQSESAMLTHISPLFWLFPHLGHHRGPSRVSQAIRQVLIGYLFYTLEKATATHSGTLAWKVPWTEKPGRLQSLGSQKVQHNWVTSLHLMYIWDCSISQFTPPFLLPPWCPYACSLCLLCK